MQDGQEVYYISIQSGQVSREPQEGDSQFRIIATDQEYRDIEVLANELYDSDLKTHFRAQIPFLEYHHDKENDEYDSRLISLYEKIYQLGDAETKAHIDSMGILGRTTLNNEDAF
ncbi:hypothetical protein [Bacillus testis]|uniref:hypothetical protein n=1 Tax=Bacillus testis TaxID=1622072 RepID=UPI00067F492A|nr:hypothetical protein [Bacillus testis]